MYANNMNSISNDSLVALCATFRLVSNPNRLRILLMLSQGEYSVSEVEAELSIKQPGLSQELRNLRDSGLVKTRRESKVIFYSSCSNENMKTVLALCSSLLGSGHVIDIPKFNEKPLNTEIRHLQRNGECGHFASLSHMK